MTDAAQPTEPKKLTPEEAKLVVEAIEDVERAEAQSQPQESESKSE